MKSLAWGLLAIAIIGGVWGVSRSQRLAARAHAPAVVAAAPAPAAAPGAETGPWTEYQQAEGAGATYVESPEVVQANANLRAQRLADDQARATAKAVADELERRARLRGH
jgi:hypothetical protein